MAINVLTIKFRRDDSQTQQRSHTASLDCVVNRVSKDLNSNLLVRLNICTLGFLPVCSRQRCRPGQCRHHVRPSLHSATITVNMNFGLFSSELPHWLPLPWEMCASALPGENGKHEICVEMNQKRQKKHHRHYRL